MTAAICVVMCVQAAALANGYNHCGTVAARVRALVRVTVAPALEGFARRQAAQWRDSYSWVSSRGSDTLGVPGRAAPLCGGLVSSMFLGCQPDGGYADLQVGRRFNSHHWTQRNWAFLWCRVGGVNWAIQCSQPIGLQYCLSVSQ